MSMEDFFARLKENEEPTKEIEVPSRKGVPTNTLLDASDESSSQTADIAEGLRWGHTEGNMHSGGALMQLVNFCAHAIGLGTRGKRSHNNRDDFTIS